MNELEAMRRAIRISRKGCPAPNPHVGCVLLKDGEVVGEGWHVYAGGPHAEVVALQAAGEKARGATAFVTMEPCDHHGRTGPCSEALVAAGVERVFVAVPDPNPAASGGAEALRRTGVAVEMGLLTQEAEAANEVWLTAVRRRRPYVCIKAATSLDGRIALPSGESQWITGQGARRAGHRLRAEMGAVLVGRRTVELDDPLLTVRGIRVKNQPLRIVLDPSGKLPPTCRLLSDGGPTLRLVADGSAPLGCVDGRFDPKDLLKMLFERGVTSVLVEGGAVTAGGLLPYADRLEVFVGAVALGAGPSWLTGAFAESLSSAPRFAAPAVRRYGPDVRLTYRVPRT